MEADFKSTQRLVAPIFLKMTKIGHFALKASFSTISTCIFKSINACLCPMYCSIYNYISIWASRNFQKKMCNIALTSAQILLSFLNVFDFLNPPDDTCKSASVECLRCIATLARLGITSEENN